MSVREEHPQYTAGVPEMIKVRDCFEGQDQIKDKDTIYLPATAGQAIDGKATGSTQSKGAKDYAAYKLRAIFHDFVRDAVETAVGIMHRKPADIELPASMEDLVDNATVHNESLQDLLKNINVGQLIEGRIGILADMPKVPKEGRENLPYIATYNGICITNWDDGSDEELVVGSLNLVVLNESSPERQDDLSWDEVEKYRVLIYGMIDPNEPEQTAVYRVAIVEPEKQDETTLTSLANADLIEPQIRGNTLDEIPFVFINSRDINPDVDQPPLLGLANLALAIYRQEADYQQSLHMQSQETFVIIGGKKGGKGKSGKSDDGVRLGAGASLNLDTDGDAKYVGVSANGLSEQKDALENNKKRADEKAGKLLDTRGKAKESNEALETRIAAGTTTLVQIVQAGAKGLEKQLKQIAKWMGANEDEVKVTPNIDFEDIRLAAIELESFMKAKLLGAPLSLETIHRIMAERELTNMSFEDEVDLLNEEFEDVPEGPAPGGTGGQGSGAAG